MSFEQNQSDTSASLSDLKHELSQLREEQEILEAKIEYQLLYVTSLQKIVNTEKAKKDHFPLLIEGQRRLVSYQGELQSLRMSIAQQNARYLLERNRVEAKDDTDASRFVEPISLANEED